MRGRLPEGRFDVLPRPRPNQRKVCGDVLSHPVKRGWKRKPSDAGSRGFDASLGAYTPAKQGRVCHLRRKHTLSDFCDSERNDL